MAYWWTWEGAPVYYYGCRKEGAFNGSDAYCYLSALLFAAMAEKSCIVFEPAAWDWVTR